ncbi:MAG: tyrosine--tRNA ligase, partial [Bacteroidales bacterium]|nr:tyrosine--tRNA ligase [Bacteroidales bacterium]
SEQLRSLDERTFLAVFSGVPTFEVSASELPCNILDFLAVKTGIYPSKGEARKALQQNGFSLNKDKVGDIAYEISGKDIVDGKYILAQKGKRNYFLVKIV